MNRKLLIGLILFFSHSLTSFAQENRVIKELDELHNQLILNKPVKDNEAVLFKAGNEQFVLSGLKPWITDTLTKVKFHAISIVGRVGLKTNEPAVKQEAVRYLIQFSNTKNEALSKSALGYLIRFNRRDFAKDACDSVRYILQKQLPSFDRIIRLTGFLGLTDQVPYLDSILLTGVSTKIQWSINLALARLGKIENAQYCYNLAKAYPVDDNVIYNILPDLIYTRQRVLFDYLVDILNSDEPRCTSPNPYYSGNILCGYRVMEELAAVVNGVPLKVNSSREIVIDDYDKALKIARTWFNEHKADYELKNDVY